MEFLYSGRLVDILITAAVILLAARVHKDRKEQDEDIRAYLLDMDNNTGKTEHKISRKVTTIGRIKGRGVDLCVPKNTVSEQHAQIEYRNGNFYLTDLRSGNGTYLNGSKEGITGQVYLRDGDTITFDKYTFKFVLSREAKRHVKQPYGGAYNRTILKGPSD